MSLWEFINPGDSYEKGYECGFEDGKTPNKKRNAPWTEEIKYVTAIWNREAFWKSFHDGYNKGFTDGLRERNNLFGKNGNANNDNITTNNKKNMNSFEYQYQLLTELEERLNTFTHELNNLSSDYMKKVSELNEAGMMKETFEKFQFQCLIPTMQQIKNLTERLQAHDLKTVKEEKEYIEMKL